MKIVKNNMGLHLLFGKTIINGKMVKDIYSIAFWFKASPKLRSEISLTLSKRVYVISSGGIHIHIRDERLFDTILFAFPAKHRLDLLSYNSLMMQIENHIDPYRFFSPEYYSKHQAETTDRMASA